MCIRDRCPKAAVLNPIHFTCPTSHRKALRLRCAALTTLGMSDRLRPMTNTPTARIACAVCQASFVPRRTWARFCSVSCRAQDWARTHPRVEVRGQAGSVRLSDERGANAVLEALSQIETIQARLAQLEAKPPVKTLAVKSPSSPATWKHGANCYRNHGCRCQICVEGMRGRRRTAG